MAFSPPLIALFQVRFIKRNYRADGSYLTSTSGMPNGIKATILQEELAAAGQRGSL